MNILSALIILGVVGQSLPDNVLYTYMDDDSVVTISDSPAKECGEEYFRATVENSEGYNLDACWLPDVNSADVKVLLPNRAELLIRKDSFIKAPLIPCETDSQCEGLY